MLEIHRRYRCESIISFGNRSGFLTGILDLLRDGCLKCKQADYNATVEKLRVPYRHKGVNIKFYRNTLSKPL